jgi:hypothetical protein
MGFRAELKSPANEIRASGQGSAGKAAGCLKKKKSPRWLGIAQATRSGREYGGKLSSLEQNARSLRTRNSARKNRELQDPERANCCAVSWPFTVVAKAKPAAACGNGGDKPFRRHWGAIDDLVTDYRRRRDLPRGADESGPSRLNHSDLHFNVGQSVGQTSSESCRMPRRLADAQSCANDVASNFYPLAIGVWRSMENFSLAAPVIRSVGRGRTMKRSKFTEAPIAFILRQAEEGTVIGEVCRNRAPAASPLRPWVASSCRVHPASCGRSVRIGARQSMPSSGIANCAGVTAAAAPADIAGQIKGPFASRLANRHRSWPALA